MFSHCDRSDLLALTGEAGTVFLCNPGQCYHCGARATGKPRLMLIVNVTTPFEGAEGQSAVYWSTNRRLLDEGSPEYRALLNL